MVVIGDGHARHLDASGARTQQDVPRLFCTKRFAVAHIKY